MMDAARRLDEVRELLRRAEVELREEHLGGESGGLCVIRGRPVLFFDLDADPAVCLERCLEGVRRLPGIDNLFIPPALRELLDRDVSADS